MDYYVTPERLEALKKELEEMKTVSRMEVASRLKRAKELGDLSENSEYIEAREEQAQLERSIFDIEQLVKNAMIIKKPASGGDKIQIGSTFEVLKDGKTLRYTIVGSREARPEAGLISNESPIGKAFLGGRVGDIIKVKVPMGEVVYKISRIE